MQDRLLICKKFPIIKYDFSESDNKIISKSIRYIICIVYIYTIYHRESYYF